MKFKIQVDSCFRRRQGVEHLIVAYGPEGTTVRGDGLSVKIPAFDGTKIDKCDPQTPVEPLCAEVPNFTLQITKIVDGQDEQMASLTVAASGSENPVAYLWEIQDGRPAMANAQIVVPRFLSTGPKTKQLNVTAFTKEGCRVMQKDEIELREPGL